MVGEGDDGLAAPGSIIETSHVYIHYVAAPTRTAYTVILRGSRHGSAVSPVPEFNWLQDTLRTSARLLAECGAALMLGDVRWCIRALYRACVRGHV